MKNIIFYTCLLFCSLPVFAQQKLQEVNAVLHDESYVAAFGFLPDAGANEQERIQLHLWYAEQLLRTADTTKLTSGQLPRSPLPRRNLLRGSDTTRPRLNRELG